MFQMLMQTYEDGSVMFADADLRELDIFNSLLSRSLTLALANKLPISIL